MIDTDHKCRADQILLIGVGTEMKQDQTNVTRLVRTDYDNSYINNADKCRWQMVNERIKHRQYRIHTHNLKHP